MIVQTKLLVLPVGYDKHALNRFFFRKFFSLYAKFRGILLTLHFPQLRAPNFPLDLPSFTNVVSFESRDLYNLVFLLVGRLWKPILRHWDSNWSVQLFTGIDGSCSYVWSIFSTTDSFPRLTSSPTSVYHAVRVTPVPHDNDTWITHEWHTDRHRRTK